jgi:two-component system cell cycle response regulator
VGFPDDDEDDIPTGEMTLMTQRDAIVARNPKTGFQDACLVVIYGPELGRRAQLGRAPFMVGRSAKSDLPIDQESVSRQHARISFSGERFTVEDMGSTNGTFVNDIQVSQVHALRDGDQIKIGSSILKFMAGDNIEANYHEEIYRLMTVDALTQTHNKRYFGEALEREFGRANRYRRELSLIAFDLDHFKKVNDTYGHLSGDAVLRQMALAVRPRLRQQDIFARVGGEEFCIILPEVGLAGARVTAEKVRRIVEALPVQAENRIIRCTVSLGVAGWDTTLESALALHKAADVALYAAKQGGRNRFVG